MSSGFDLDLQAIEEHIEPDDGEARVVLGVLDGTNGERWLSAVESGAVLVLAVEGDLSDLAADLAPAVKERDGNVVHFRGFLVVTPAGVAVDTTNL